MSEELVREKAAAMTADLQLEGREEEVAVEAVSALLDFLMRTYGTAFIDALPRMNHPGDLGTHLASTYKTTTYRVMLEAFMAWDKEREEEDWNKAALERTETAHFVLLTMPGTEAHRERDFIARVCEEYLDASAAVLLPDEGATGRFHTNLAALAGGKAEIVLPPNSRAFGRFNDTSMTNYRFAVTSDGNVRIQIAIHLPYFNALSTIPLAHEIVHMRDILQKIDLAAAPGFSDNTGSEENTRAFKAWAQDTFSRTVPNDQPIGEGIAEYGAARINPIRRSFCLPPDEELRVLATQAPLASDMLSRSLTVKDRKLRLTRYTAAHSFVAFLIDTYGEDRFLDFYLRVPPDEANFIAAYGTGFSAMHIRWNEARR